MASLPELARFRTDLERADIDHLQRLLVDWGLLADLCFSDLLLWAPVTARPDLFVVLAHIRPATSQTIYWADLAGEEVTTATRPLVARCFRTGTIEEGDIDHTSLQVPIRVLSVPVRHRGHQVAVMTRESAPSLGRQQGELEVTYDSIFDRFAAMTANGTFPYEFDDHRPDFVPRVGDGVMLLDAEGMVVFTSPNAFSALVRLGVTGNAEGRRLSELGLDEAAVRRCIATRTPHASETERGGDTTVLMRCLPLLEDHAVTGVVCMVRDISELRSRDRLLISKDATIREIHHRVKNNLQTISSLLRLQGRRLTNVEAKAAVEESVRRIRSIALVHETLSREAGEDVPFIEIVRPLVRMVEEGYSSPDRPLHFKVRGDAGKLPAPMATPLAVVLTELLQNVVDHAYPVGEEVEPGEAVVEMDSDGQTLRVRVVDDGVGLPPSFSFDRANGLGLQIVRTLVETELGGSINMTSGEGSDGPRGTRVEIEVPVRSSWPVVDDGSN